MYIYIYSTEIYEQNNLFKIGQTTQSPENRVKQQDGTSNPEELRLLHYWHAPGMTDRFVHNHLERLGYERPRPNREWFKGNKEHLIHEISQFLDSHSARSEIQGHSMITPADPYPYRDMDWWAIALMIGLVGNLAVVPILRGVLL